MMVEKKRIVALHQNYYAGTMPFVWNEGKNTRFVSKNEKISTQKEQYNILKAKKHNIPCIHLVLVPFW